MDREEILKILDEICQRLEDLEAQIEALIDPEAEDYL